MSEQNDNPFVAGAEVAHVMRERWGGGVSFKRVTVGKVHKSGNFSLEGEKEQWRAHQSSYGDRTWSAHRRGGERWTDYGSLEPITPKLLEEVAQAKLRGRLAKAAETIGKFHSRLTVTEDLVARLEAIAALTKEEKSNG